MFTSLPGTTTARTGGGPRCITRTAAVLDGSLVRESRRPSRVALYGDVVSCKAMFMFCH